MGHLKRVYFIIQFSAGDDIYPTNEEQDFIYFLLSGSVLVRNFNEISHNIYTDLPFFSIYEGNQLPDYEHFLKFKNKHNPISNFKHKI